MTRHAHRWAGALAGGAAAGGALLACTLTQSLDYLQQGDEDGGTSIVPEGGAGDEDAAPSGRVPVVLVPNQARPALLAQDATTLYWIADGKVLSAPKTGGDPRILGTASLATSRLAVDSDPAGFVFIAVGKDVSRLPKDGSGGGTIFTGAAGEAPASALAADEASLFVLQYDDSFTIEASRIVRMAKDGGGLVELARDGGPTTLNLDPTSVVWLDGDFDQPAFHVQDKAAAGTTTIRFPLTAADDIPYSSADVALDQDFIFWTVDEATAGGATIFRRARAAPAGVDEPIGRGLAEDSFSYIAVDDTFVYVIETTKSTLVRAPKSGLGPTEALFAGLQAPSGLVVDATAIYLTVQGSGNVGAVIKLAK